MNQIEFGLSGEKKRPSKEVTCEELFFTKTTGKGTSKRYRDEKMRMSRLIHATHQTVFLTVEKMRLDEWIASKAIGQLWVSKRPWSKVNDCGSPPGR